MKIAKMTLRILAVLLIMTGSFLQHSIYEAVYHPLMSPLMLIAGASLLIAVNWEIIRKKHE